MGFLSEILGADVDHDDLGSVSVRKRDGRESKSALGMNLLRMRIKSAATIRLLSGFQQRVPLVKK